MLRVSATSLIVFGLAACCFAQEAEEPLKLELPEEVLAGTPPDVLAMLFPELEKPAAGKQPELLVPKGTVNLALNKPVTASDTNPVLGELKLVTDGVKEGTEDKLRRAFAHAPVGADRPRTALGDLRPLTSGTSSARPAATAT